MEAVVCPGCFLQEAPKGRKTGSPQRLLPEQVAQACEQPLRLPSPPTQVSPACFPSQSSLTGPSAGRRLPAERSRGRRDAPRASQGGAGHHCTRRPGLRSPLVQGLTWALVRAALGESPRLLAAWKTGLRPARRPPTSSLQVKGATPDLVWTSCHVSMLLTVQDHPFNP